MQGSLKRFISEWQLPSVLLVRVGFPFVAGLYDVKPTVTTERSRHAGKVRALNLSIVSATKTSLASALRYFSHRVLTIGICQALYSYTSNNQTKLSFLQNAAVEAESSERHTEFSIRQILRLVGVPEKIAGAMTTINRSTADDIYCFKTEAQNNSGFFGHLSTYLQRHMLTSICSSLHSLIIFGISSKVLRPSAARDGHLAVYLYDVNAEVYGVPCRRWQMYAAIGTNFSQALGSSFGAAFASLIAPSVANNNSDGSSDKTLQVASLLLFLGEFCGGVVGMTLFRSLHIKYRKDLVENAKVEERHHQAAMAELMSYTSAGAR